MPVELFLEKKKISQILKQIKKPKLLQRLQRRMKTEKAMNYNLKEKRKIIYIVFLRTSKYIYIF